jgi:hypothetical protein
MSYMSYIFHWTVKQYTELSEQANDNILKITIQLYIQQELLEGQPATIFSANV